MGHDQWLNDLRTASTDPAHLVALFNNGVPPDGLQHAGTAALTTTLTPGMATVITRIVGALRQRNWDGDNDLVVALEHSSSGEPSGLVPVAVDLGELAEALDESAGSDAYIDLHTGTVWPAELLDIDQGPDDFDADDDTRWLPVTGQGSGPGWQVMERFITTIDDPNLRQRLERAIVGNGAFRRFMNTLERDPDQLTRWHRYRADAELGRARHWLANHGYQPQPS